ncbi:MAG TPA: UbiX family flavin prenyltransferase [Acidimicrobiia bacterium]|nr:UbiX family flavin prenyltransferase [Acidimicrobiia bacterium]
MTGATGAIMGVRLLEVLKDLGIPTELVMSEWAQKTISLETGRTPSEVAALAGVVHPSRNLGASISSGSYQTAGMVVVPCSMKTLASIAAGSGGTLIDRAADVTIKERRPLVLVARETPLSPIHLENMLKLSRIGVVVMPPVPAFYNHPTTIEDAVDHIVGRVLDQIGIESGLVRRWKLGG